MDKAYIDENAGQAICCWEAPDKKTLEELFTKAQIFPQSIREVTEFTT
jgi:hypothetical protein